MYPVVQPPPCWWPLLDVPATPVLWQPGLQAAAFTTRARSWLAFQVLSRRDLNNLFCKPTRHPAGTQPVLLHTDYSFKILGGISWWARKQRDFFLIKSPPDFCCLLYMFFLLLICYLCGIISSKWGWCISKGTVVSCSNAFLGLAILFQLKRGGHTPKYKLGGGERKGTVNDFWTYLLVTLHFKMLIFPAL